MVKEWLDGGTLGLVVLMAMAPGHWNVEQVGKPVLRDGRVCLADFAP